MPSVQIDRTLSEGSQSGLDPSSPIREPRNVHFGPESPELDREETPTQGIRHADTGLSTLSATDRRKSREEARRQRKAEGERDAYYDSRAATKREFRRRASTLQEYYAQNPTLLPQLPFTWRHGWKRWKLFLTIFLIIVDACVIPLVLYYTLKFIGNVQGWISEFYTTPLLGLLLTYFAQSSPSSPPSGVVRPTLNLRYEAGDYGRKRISSGHLAPRIDGPSTLLTGSRCSQLPPSRPSLSSVARHISSGYACCQCRLLRYSIALEAASSSSPCTV